MNPSSGGWIAKFFSHSSKIERSGNQKAAYNELRSFGFTFGINVGMSNSVKAYHRYSEDELAKLNLIYGLNRCYSETFEGFDLSDFSLSVLQFYRAYQVSESIETRPYSASAVLRKFQQIVSPSEKEIPNNSKSRLKILESIIGNRVHSSDFNLVKNHLQSINKALLYIDVLCYELYLENPEKVSMFAAKMESYSLWVIYQSLKLKSEPKPFDTEIKQLIKKTRVIATSNEPSFEAINEETSFCKKSRCYLFDLACRFSLQDHRFDAQALSFLQDLAGKLLISEKEMKSSLDFAMRFGISHQKRIDQIQNVNLISNIYDGSSQMVSKLIQRNSKRLIKEIKQSRELMGLLTKSTYSDLTKEEQKELQLQLLDMLKTIPSLAIFLLPGGAILLPLFAKLIPNIIPSAFDDNRIEE